MKAVEELLSRWREQAGITDNIAVWKVMPGSSPGPGSFPPGLNLLLHQVLEESGIPGLYTHQLAAWDLITSNKNVILTTGTSSGKSLAFHLPVLNALLSKPGLNALYLFPTKALCHDQANKLNSLIGAINQIDSIPHPEITPAGIYDGDTSNPSRQTLRKNAHLLFSNPDMLHLGILPHHTQWDTFFTGLQYIVLDEVHIYKGIFGSHVANVLRRLKRIAAHYGSRPVFILTSATIENPLEFGQALIEEPLELVAEDGSPHGDKNFLVYNPPLINSDLGVRKSAYQESANLSESLLNTKISTIIFGRSRRSVELLLNYLREKLLIEGYPQAELDKILRSYRSGYLATKRREIEASLRSGETQAVIATNALEIGIDIGHLDASLMIGYPGSIASLWQQAGRSGRTMDPSLAILVLTQDPLDQYLRLHPEYLWERNPEKVLINPDNLVILLSHLRCAAFEIPFEGQPAFGNVEQQLLTEMLNYLASQQDLVRSSDSYYWIASRYPAQEISLRTASPDRIMLLDESGAGSKIIGEIDGLSADIYVHPGAIYLHEGVSYLVKNLDFEARKAFLDVDQSDYYTLPHLDTQVTRLSTIQEVSLTGLADNPYQIAYGDLDITKQVTKFRKLKWYTNEMVGSEDVNLPVRHLATSGFWLALDKAFISHLKDQGMWSNEPNDYGPNWPRQRDLARQRDQFRCRLCGLPENGQAHHVHHKTPFRLFITSEQANTLDNLVTLCPNCHRRVELNVKIASGMAGVAYVMSHLVPLFLMCDQNDLGVHVDSQNLFLKEMQSIVIYENIPGGIGLSRHIFDRFPEIMSSAYELVSACECADGCPACTGPGGENGLGGKNESLAIINLITKQT